MNDISLNSIINVSDFLLEIERIATDKNIDHIDAVIHYCSKTGMEIETAAELIKKNAKIKAKLKSDAETIGYLPKTAKLPL
jgi:hypothetical protein